MKRFPQLTCAVIALLGYCVPVGCTRDEPPNQVFCTRISLREMLTDVTDTNTPDKDTQAVRPDAQALRQNIDYHPSRGGPSSPSNVASFEKFRAFVRKKCNGRDIGTGLTNLAPGMVAE